MTDSSSGRHRHQAARMGQLSVAVLTVSDSRTVDTDVNGNYLREQLKESGHRMAAYRLVPDESEAIIQALDEFSEPSIQVVLINGGTGISGRDGTFEVVSERLEKVLPGFGELFRMLSFEEIGSAAMLSRATAGLCRHQLLFSVPGSPKAVQLAWKKLIQPELHHLVWEMLK